MKPDEPKGWTCPQCGGANHGAAGHCWLCGHGGSKREVAGIKLAKQIAMGVVMTVGLCFAAIIAFFVVCTISLFSGAGNFHVGP